MENTSLSEKNNSTGFNIGYSYIEKVARTKARSDSTASKTTYSSSYYAVLILLTFSKGNPSQLSIEKDNL